MCENKCANLFSSFFFDRKAKLVFRIFTFTDPVLRKSCCIPRREKISVTTVRLVLVSLFGQQTTTAAVLNFERSVHDLTSNKILTADSQSRGGTGDRLLDWSCCSNTTAKFWRNGNFLFLSKISSQNQVSQMTMVNKRSNERFNPNRTDVDLPSRTTRPVEQHFHHTQPTHLAMNHKLESLHNSVNSEADVTKASLVTS